MVQFIFSRGLRKTRSFAPRVQKWILANPKPQFFSGIEGCEGPGTRIANLVRRSQTSCKSLRIHFLISGRISVALDAWMQRSARWCIPHFGSTFDDGFDYGSKVLLICLGGAVQGGGVRQALLHVSASRQLVGWAGLVGSFWLIYSLVRWLDILWMDKILHHFETMRDHFLVFTGESSFQGIFRWCRISSIYSTTVGGWVLWFVAWFLMFPGVSPFFLGILL